MYLRNWNEEAKRLLKSELVRRGITHDELILFEPDNRLLLHEYEEYLNVTVKCYRIEEIIIEKMRNT